MKHGVWYRLICLSFRTTGDGEWGEPKKRARGRIEEDLRNGLLSVEEAKRMYGLNYY